MNKNENRSNDYREHDIVLTVKYLRHLVRKFDIPLEDLLLALELSKKDREMYTKIITKRIPKKSKAIKQPEAMNE